MTTERNPADWDLDPFPLSAESIAMDSEATYRERENSYRRSSAYAGMRRRYPQLRYWIARCRQPDLIGGSASPAAPQPVLPGVMLQWQRSHGED